MPKTYTMEQIIGFILVLVSMSYLMLQLFILAVDSATYFN